MTTSLGRQLRQRAGLWRSLAIYYGVPGRIRQLTDFYRPFIRPNDLCFDVGAHVGNRILAWSRLGARVVALEPQAALMGWLERRYGGAPGVTLVAEAVGAAAGLADLHIDPTNPTVSTLSADWMATVSDDDGFAGVSWSATERVPVTTLDALITRYGEPAFCKIDIEGYELEALRGLSRPLRALSFEFLPAAIDSAAGCLARLGALGDYEYNWFPGESHRLQSARWLSPDEMAGELVSLGRGRDSGDIFARLRSVA